MKKNGLLFIALAAIAAGIYFSTKGKKVTASKVGTTGTAGATPTSFWDALLERGASAAGQRANSVISGGGWSGGGKYDKDGGNLDVSPIVKGAIGTVAGLIGGAGKWFGEKIFGGSQRTKGTSPGTSPDYGNDPFADLFDGYSLASEPDASEGGGFNGPAWIPDGSPYLFGSDEGDAPQAWNNESDLPLDDAYNVATSEEEFFSRN